MTGSVGFLTFQDVNEDLHKIHVIHRNLLQAKVFQIQKGIFQFLPEFQLWKRVHTGPQIEQGLLLSVPP